MNRRQVLTLNDAMCDYYARDTSIGGCGCGLQPAPVATKVCSRTRDAVGRASGARASRLRTSSAVGAASRLGCGHSSSPRSAAAYTCRGSSPVNGCVSVKSSWSVAPVDLYALGASRRAKPKSTSRA